MPSIMKSCPLNYDIAEKEYVLFKKWFDQRTYFKERDIVKELKKYNHLCLLMGFLGSKSKPDLYKHEFSIQGAFRADFVAASSSRREFTFVEFEGAELNSIFGPKQTNQMRDWGNQIQHGFSQVADWTWAKNDVQKNTLFQNSVGFLSIFQTWVLICGRDASMDVSEKERLDWRHSKTNMAGDKILFMTYDDLMNHFEGSIDVYRVAKNSANGTLGAP